MTQMMDFGSRNPISKPFFDSFYTLMEKSFPKQMRRTREAFWQLCQNEPRYHIYTWLQQGCVYAFFTLWELPSFRFVDHFAVSPDLRCGGIGSRILQEVLQKSTLPLVLEAELPETELAKRRLNFYKRNGFFEHPFPYLMPPVQADCEAVPMKLLSSRPLSEKEFYAVRDCLHKEVYNI